MSALCSSYEGWLTRPADALSGLVADAGLPRSVAIQFARQCECSQYLYPVQGSWCTPPLPGDCQPSGPSRPPLGHPWRDCHGGARTRSEPRPFRTADATGRRTTQPFRGCWGRRGCCSLAVLGTGAQRSPALRPSHRPAVPLHYLLSLAARAPQRTL